MDLVTLKSFEDSTNANLLRSKIRSAGIPCELKDSKTVEVDPILSQAIGGIKVQVPKDRLKDALLIMDGMLGMHITNSKGQMVYCPQCESRQVVHSDNFKEGLIGVWQKFVETIKSFNPKYSSNYYQCRVCDTKFHFLFVER